MPPPDEGEYLTFDEVCKRYGWTRYGLRKLIRQHGLTSYRKGLSKDRRGYLNIAELEEKIGGRPTG